MSDLKALFQEQAVQGEKISKIETACEKIEESLLGNGKPGLVVRTDRLEQRDKFKTRLFWIFSTVVVALLVETIGADILAAIIVGK